MQDLQKTSWQPDDASSSERVSGVEEERACRDLSARIENAVMPQLGSMAARCSRLFSQASVAMGARFAFPGRLGDGLCGK